MPDTTCIVASVSHWHQFHQRARAEIDRRRAQAETMTLAAPALVEAYSVLTRLPRPLRLAPAGAFQILEANFFSRGQVIALDHESYLDALRHASFRGTAGGGIYDAVIAACALSVNVDALLTFNARHFRDFAALGLQIVVP